MAKRRYDQYCALARALDVIGERWTLLVVRELLLGPRRYTDLLASLPGIGTNLLAARLRDLEEAEVVERRTLPPPAASAVYDLTARGRELEPAVLALVQWGRHRLGPPGGDQHFRPAWLGILMRTAFRPEAAAGLRETYELRVAGEVFHVRVDDGTAEIREGPADAPAVTVAMEPETFGRVVAGGLALADVEDLGLAEVEGDRAALARWAETFALAAPAPA